MTRGAIYWVNIEDTQPLEFGKIRPALVLSNSEQNAILSTVVVVPMSARPPHIWPLRLELPPTPRLKKSFAVIPGIRQVSKSRLIESTCVLPDEFVNTILEALAAYLGD